MKKNFPKRKALQDEKYSFILNNIFGLKSYQFELRGSTLFTCLLGAFFCYQFIFWGVPHSQIIGKRLALLGYQDAYTQNHSQKKQITQFLKDIETNRKVLVYLNYSKQDIRRSLGHQIQYDFELLSRNYNNPYEVSLKSETLGERLNKHEVLIGNRPVLTFYLDQEKKYSPTTDPQSFANRLRQIIANRQLNQKVVVEAANGEASEYVGKIEGKELFRIAEKDTIFYASDAQQLAEKWAKQINAELELVNLHLSEETHKKDKLAAKLPIYTKIKTHHRFNFKMTQNNLSEILKNLEDTKSEYLTLRKQTVQQARQFAQTPSTVPIELPISSMYGYRIHPISKRLRFHSGVDFTAYWGSPVHATASGRVVYSGWYGGYGKAVRIYHGWGLSTLYAHNSALLVHKGQWVRKGQVIAKAGATGMAEGSHVHYEVHKWGRAINPLPYLNADIMSASTIE